MTDFYAENQPQQHEGYVYDIADKNSLTASENEANEAMDNPVNTIKQPNNPSSKIIIWSLAVLGTISLIFGGLRWFTSLKLPFTLHEQVAQTTPNKSETEPTLLELKQQDTDYDGLSDYDELYVYQTSPYITDTDSDGYADGLETTNGQDPNCPAGQVCAIGETGSESTINLPASADNLTTEQLRNLLISAGLTQEQVSSLDDATLKQLYSEVLSEKSQDIASTASQNDLAPDNSLTASQIRELLKESGARDEELANISDDELAAGWSELMAQEMNKESNGN